MLDFIQDAFFVNAVLATAHLVFIAIIADRYEREPTRNLLKLFVIAVLATGLFGILKCDVLKLCEEMTGSPFENFIMAGTLEELLKFGILFWFLRRTRDVDEPLDGIVYLTVIALGFAFDENIGYVLTYTEAGRAMLVNTGDRALYDEQFRMITIVRALPGHLLFNTVGGWLLAVGIRRGRLWRFFVPALVVSILLHGIWNQLAVSLWFFLYALALIVLSVVAIAWAMRRSPFRVRQNALMERVRAVEWPDGGLPRRLRSALRRTDGNRQAEMMTVVGEALAETPAEGGERIAGMLTEESSRGNPFYRVLLVVGGVLVLFYAAELVLMLLKIGIAALFY